MAVPMANDPPFATLNHFAADLGIPSESDLLRTGITSHLFGERSAWGRARGRRSEIRAAEPRQPCEPPSLLICPQHHASVLGTFLEVALLKLQRCPIEVID